MVTATYFRDVLVDAGELAALTYDVHVPIFFKGTMNQSQIEVEYCPKDTFRCSDGWDRYSQDYFKMHKICPRSQISVNGTCIACPASAPITANNYSSCVSECGDGEWIIPGISNYCSGCGQLVDSTHSKCVNFCPWGEYSKSLHQCEVCTGVISLDRKECLTTCPQTYVLQGGKYCGRVCSGGEYKDANNQCQKCPTSSPYTSSNGSSCVSSCKSMEVATQVFNGTQCLASCPEGFIRTPDGTVCSRTWNKLLKDELNAVNYDFWHYNKFQAIWSAATRIKNAAIANFSNVYEDDCIENKYVNPGEEGDRLTEKCLHAIIKWQALDSNPFSGFKWNTGTLGQIRNITIL